MNSRDLEYFHRVLTQSLNDLLNKGNEIVAHLIGSTDGSSDLIDQANYETDRSFRLRMRDRESNLIRKINQSLSRIEDGSFGICEVCGEEISIKRLKARPVATYCIACKNEMEAREKIAGG